jgi:hypothetical protein
VKELSVHVFEHFCLRVMGLGFWQKPVKQHHARVHELLEEVQFQFPKQTIT